MSLMVTGKPLQNEFVRPCLGQDAIADLAVGLLVHLLQSRGVFTLGSLPAVVEAQTTL